MSDIKSDYASDEVDVSNLKVVDLKTQLKSLGLQTTGKKVDLVTRLQAALMAKRDAAAPLASACGSSPRKMKDYVHEDTLSSSEVGIGENEDSGKSEEMELSEDLLDLKDEDLVKEDDLGHLDKKGVAKFQDEEIFPVGVFNLVPAIKRCLPQEEVETVEPMKKSLKKNNFSSPILDAKVVKAKEEEVDQSGDIAEKSNVVAGVPNESRKPIMVKFANNPYRGLSDSAKQEKRAHRFNIISNQEQLTAGNENKKQVSESQQTVQKTKNIAYPAPTLAVLKKRAERFGETSSTLLKKLEEEEKLNQRKIRFGKSSDGNKGDDDEEKKRKRAERFGK